MAAGKTIKKFTLNLSFSSHPCVRTAAIVVSEMMDKSRRTVQMLMKELLDEGVIERIGSKKKGSWLVK